jgi:hypothetical protein
MLCWALKDSREVGWALLIRFELDVVADRLAERATSWSFSLGTASVLLALALTSIWSLCCLECSSDLPISTFIPPDREPDPEAEPETASNPTFAPLCLLSRMKAKPKERRFPFEEEEELLALDEERGRLVEDEG